MEVLNIKNFSCVEITDTLVEKCVTDLDFLYSKNEYLKENTQQTKDILFDERNPCFGEHWKLFKNSFLESAKKYSGIENNQCKAWVFACFPQVKAIQYAWHTHNLAKFSGIMYLALPEKSNTTEFMNKDNTTFFLPKRTKEWFMFQKDYVHRNGYWDHLKMDKKRYCLVASII